MLVNGTPSIVYSEIFNLNPGGSTGVPIVGFYSTPQGPSGISSTLSHTSVITTGRTLQFGATTHPAGTTLYKYTTPVYGTAPSSPLCAPVSPSAQPTPYYSIAPGPFPATSIDCTSTNGTVQYNTGASLFYYVESPELPSLSTATKLLQINRPDNFPVSGLVEDDKVSFILNISASNNNFTASVSQGSLIIGSLASSTGYASVVAPYFHSASMDISIAEGGGSTNIITFPVGLSNFHNNNYQFNPNPFTGSINAINSLYNIYGDVDYPFNVGVYDIAQTYLADGTYIENRIISSSYSGSFFRIHLDKIMSNQHVRNLMSESYQRFLLLKRVEDETSIYLTFNKRSGRTSYGFTIPEDLSLNVLDNINAITSQVKQKLLADQQGTVS
jgi:hypothetical protein